MTKYELIKSVASVLAVLAENNINVADYRYVQLFEDYQRLKSEGHKYDYIVYYLSTQYECGVTTVWRIVKRLQESVRL